jgi:hypothetical protein
MHNKGESMEDIELEKNLPTGQAGGKAEIH